MHCNATEYTSEFNKHAVSCIIVSWTVIAPGCLNWRSVYRYPYARVRLACMLNIRKFDQTEHWHFSRPSADIEQFRIPVINDSSDWSCPADRGLNSDIFTCILFQGLNFYWIVYYFIALLYLNFDLNVSTIIMWPDVREECGRTFVVDRFLSCLKYFT